MQEDDKYWDRYWAGRKALRRAGRTVSRRRRIARPDGREAGLNYWQRRQRRG